MQRNDYGELAVMAGNQEPTKLLNIRGVEVVVRGKGRVQEVRRHFPVARPGKLNSDQSPLSAESFSQSSCTCLTL
jgi:hypothetical protein